jgi:succinate dehydrogenase / fumarate reductase iron-sulfur subunit
MTVLDVPFQIFRYKSGEKPHYDSFTIQVPDSAHVIDALDTIWAEHDRNLTFRRACHHGSCGSCALRINGIEKLPCTTRITDVWDGHGSLRLDPLRNFPIVSDLVVDMGGFFQRMSASDLDIIRDAEPSLPVTIEDSSLVLPSEQVTPPENLPHFRRFENCIECGICISACPTMATDNKFFGPAGLAATYCQWQKTDDPDEKMHLLKIVNGEHGVWRCHSAFECMERCPQAVDPAGKIMALRDELVAQRFNKLGRK